MKYKFSNEEIVAKIIANCNDKEYMLNAVKIVPELLKYASNELKRDKDIILAAVSNDYYAMDLVPDELKEDEDITLAAWNNVMYNEGETLCYASDELKNDKDIAIAAISSRKNAYRFISDELKLDKDILEIMNRK